MKYPFWSNFVAALSLITVGESAKILGLFVTFSKSHLIIHKSVVEPLIDRGHNVTIVTTLPLEDSSKGYRHIQLDVPPAPKELVLGLVETSNCPFALLQHVKKSMDFSLEYSNLTLHDPKMQRLLEEETFDLIVFGVFFNMFEIGVAAHFNCPVVLSFMQRPIRVVNTIVGNPLEIAYVPEIFMGNVQPLDFFDRVRNFLMVLLMETTFLWYFDYKTANLYK